jgi:hypothetical protein
MRPVVLRWLTRSPGNRDRAAHGNAAGRTRDLRRRRGTITVVIARKGVVVANGSAKAV